MENITNKTLRKILLLDIIDNQSDDIRNQLFPNRPRYNYIMIGPKQSGRTSLLFEYAFQLAEKNLNVLFIASKRIDKLPHLIGRDQPSMKVLKRIEIIYPKTSEQFLKVLSTVHLSELHYDLVMIDDLDEYYLPLCKDTMRQVAHLSAMVMDSIAFMRKSGHDTSIICSLSSFANSLHDQNVLDTLRHWFDNFLHIYPRNNDVGYTIKTECNLLSPHDHGDVDIVGVNLIYEKGKIYVK